MHIDAPVLPGPGAARQAALIDQAGDEVDGAVSKKRDEWSPNRRAASRD
jgi:hypothetical protein